MPIHKVKARSRDCSIRSAVVYEYADCDSSAALHDMATGIRSEWEDHLLTFVKACTMPSLMRRWVLTQNTTRRCLAIVLLKRKKMSSTELSLLWPFLLSLYARRLTAVLETQYNIVMARPCTYLTPPVRNTCADKFRRHIFLTLFNIRQRQYHKWNTDYANSPRFKTPKPPKKHFPHGISCGSPRGCPSISSG